MGRGVSIDSDPVTPRHYNPSWVRSTASPVASPRFRIVWLVAGVALVGALLTANPLLTGVSVVAAALIATLLWRQGEPPILLFACGFQWLQVTTFLHHANFLGLDLRDGTLGEEVHTAVLLGLFGLVALAGGARLAWIRWGDEDAMTAEQEVADWHLPRLFMAYFATFFGVMGLRWAASSVPSVAQLVLATTTVKWVVLYLLAYSTLHTGRNPGLLVTAAALEFISGFFGFFSAFKGILFLLLVVTLASRYLWNARRVVTLIVTLALLIVASIVWSAIKVEYREFLNKGSGQQVVAVPVSERLAKLQELVSGLSEESVFEGIDAVLNRISYINYFALSLMNVPDNIPHQQGALWVGSIKHVFMPRLFFPNKGVINDSERTVEFTGVHVAGVEQGTSISIGYIGESYIDFGRFGMFAPIFLLGLLYGGIFRFFARQSRYRVVGFACGTAVLLFSAYNFETSNIKLLGGLVTSVLVMAVLLKVAEPAFLQFVRPPPASHPRLTSERRL
jgi:hypothetical protein